MEDYETEFVEFCGWYRCRCCGVTETFIPPKCPVCEKNVANYEASRTAKLQREMQRRRSDDEELL